MQSGVNYRERWKLSHVSHPCRALDTVSLVLWRSPLKRGLVLGIVRAEVQQKWAPAGGWLQIEAWVGEDGCREGRLAVGHGPQPADTDLEETHPPRALATSECRSRGRRVPTEEVQTERRSREKRTRKQRERGQECWVLIGQPGFPWPSRRTHLNFHDSLWQRWNTWTLMPSQIGYLDEWSNRGLKKKKKKAGLFGIGMRLWRPNSGQTRAVHHPGQRNTGSGGPGHPAPRVMGRQHPKTGEPPAWRSPGVPGGLAVGQKDWNKD